jgi:hypothetical protein
MKTYGEMKVQFHALTSALDGGEWSVSRLGRFTPGTHWIGGWVGPRAGLDAVAKRKFPAENWERDVKLMKMGAKLGKRRSVWPTIEWLALFYIWEVLTSNRGSEVEYPDWNLS